MKSASLSAAVVIFPWNNNQKTITTLGFFLGKLANVLLRNFYYNALGAFFDALIQRTGCCTEFLWLLVQTHHIIRCSHKRCKNCHFNQHMIFRYCIEGSGEPMQTCILPRAFAASTRDLDVYYIVQWLPAQMCRLRVFAAGVNSTQIAI